MISAKNPEIENLILRYREFNSKIKKYPVTEDENTKKFIFFWTDRFETLIFEAKTFKKFKLKKSKNRILHLFVRFDRYGLNLKKSEFFFLI